MNGLSLRHTRSRLSRRNLLLALGLVFFAFAGSLALLSRASLTSEEAHTAWLIHHDPVQVTGQHVNPMTPRETLGLLRDDLQSVVMRARQESAVMFVYALVLNLWALLVGESVLALRVFSVLAMLLAVSGWTAWGRALAGGRLALATGGMTALIGLLMLISVRITPLALVVALLAWVAALTCYVLRRWSSRAGRVSAGLMGGLLLVISAGVILTGKQAFTMVNWRETIAQVAAARSSDEPALIAFATDSPTAYYNRSTPIRKGISLDIGWRPVSTATITDLVQRLSASDAIWLIAPLNDATTQQALAALDVAGFTIRTYQVQAGDMIFYRFIQSP